MISDIDLPELVIPHSLCDLALSLSICPFGEERYYVARYRMNVRFANVHAS